MSDSKREETSFDCLHPPSSSSPATAFKSKASIVLLVCAQTEREKNGTCLAGPMLLRQTLSLLSPFLAPALSVVDIQVNLVEKCYFKVRLPPSLHKQSSSLARRRRRAPPPAPGLLAEQKGCLQSQAKQGRLCEGEKKRAKNVLSGII